MKNLAWHFVGKTLRDGSPIPPDGEWLRYSGPIKMCQSGLHASREPFDALWFAPGDTLCLVEVADVREEGKDKLVCAGRRIIARMDATEMLSYFARMQAVSCLDAWENEPGQCVLDWLMGDEAARSAAWSAAWSAARSAAESAARAAAESAARSAAESAAELAAWSAAREDFSALVYECFSDFLGENQ